MLSLNFPAGLFNIVKIPKLSHTLYDLIIGDCFANTRF